MKNEIVHSKGSDVFYDSRTIAEKFGKQHKHVLTLIDKLIAELKKDNKMADLFGSSGSFNFIKNEKAYRGKKFRYFEMGKKELLLLATRIPGTKALNFTMAEIISSFLMEKTLQAQIDKNLENQGIADKINSYWMNANLSDIPNQANTEKIYHQQIILNFEEVFPEYKYMQSEYTMEDGDRLDILAEDKKTKRPVIIEIKIGSRSAHKQLRSYSYNFDNPILVNVCYKNPNKQAKGIRYVEVPLLEPTSSW